MTKEVQLGGSFLTRIWMTGEQGQIRHDITRPATVILAGLQSHPQLLVAVILFIEEPVYMVQLADRAAILYIHMQEDGSWTIGAPAGFDALDGWSELVEVVTAAMNEAARSLEVFVLNKQWEQST